MVFTVIGDGNAERSDQRITIPHEKQATSSPTPENSKDIDCVRHQADGKE